MASFLSSLTPRSPLKASGAERKRKSSLGEAGLPCEAQSLGTFTCSPIDLSRVEMAGCSLLRRLSSDLKRWT